MKNQATVVVTGAGSSTAMGVIKGLARQKELAVRVVSCDVESMSAGAYLAQAFRRVPPVSDPSYLAVMLEVCASEKADLLIPIVDAEFGLLARNRSLFEEAGTRVAVASEEALGICTDKEATVRFFLSIGIAAPRTWRPEDLDPRPGDFPLILKPRLGGRGSIGVHRVDDRDEYRFHLAKAGDCIVQEFIEGDEFTMDTLSDFDGRPLAVIPRRRLEVRSGISYKGLVVRDQEMIDLCCRILRTLGQPGPSCIQCIIRGGVRHFIEINPRFGGGTAFTIAGAGVNTPLMLVRAALGHPMTARIGDFRDGVTLLRYWDEVVVLPGGAGGGPWT
ncbi:MAG TPA: ATP-grasp domain-containing protein [Candidatus Polarisedimenticolia bacterium]|jgi:carbamoyl-phosphate synthase large subunit